LRAKNEAFLGPFWRSSRYEALAIKLFFQVMYCALAWPVKESFGFYVFKVASASVEMQGSSSPPCCLLASRHHHRECRGGPAVLFKQYCVFLSLLKFDFFLSLIVLLMMKFLTLSIESPNLPLGIVTFVLSVVWCVCM
jgi:hypothetical protein